MFKYTKHSLKKLEEIFKEVAYQIRYEKGNFQSGYCIVEDRKIAVVNKFYDTEARINILLEIMGTMEIDTEALTDSSATFYKKIVKLNTQNFAEEGNETKVEEATKKEV